MLKHFKANQCGTGTKIDGQISEAITSYIIKYN